jgi:hypothetical protein
MKKGLIFLFTFVVFLFLLQGVFAQVVHYDFPYIAPQSVLYQVKINGELAHVYKTIIGPDYDGHNYVHFAMDEPVTIEVTKSIVNEVVDIGPKRFGIEPKIIDSKTFSFVVSEPHQYVVTTNALQMTGNGWGTSKHNLFIFADPIESDAPSLGDSNVISAKNYGNLQSALDAWIPGKLLYFPSGTYEYSNNLNIKDNSEIYLAPGAYWKDTQYIPGWHVRLGNKKNIKIGGPGTIATAGSFVVSSSSNITLKDFVKWNTGVHVEPGRYYWGSCMEIIDSDNILIDNVKSIGLAQQVGTLPYPNKTAHDGIRLRSLQNSIVKNSLSIASDDPFHIVANSKEDSINVTIQDSVAIGLAAQGYWGSVLNLDYPNNQMNDGKFIRNDVFSGTLYASGGTTHNPDLIWKDVGVDVSHHQVFFRIGGLPDYRFSDTIDAVVEGLSVYKIHTDKSTFVGFYIKGNPNVIDQKVHFKNLWIVDRYIYSFQDILDLGMDKAVMEDVDVTFEVTASGPPVADPIPVSTPTPELNFSVNCSGIKLLASFNEQGEYLDSSGSSNVGSCSGISCPTFISSGKFSGAYNFDGVDDYVSFLDSSSLDFDKRHGTISMWVKPSRFATRNLLVLDSNYEIEFNILNSKMFYYPYTDKTSGWKNYNLASSSLELNKWQHLAVTWDYSTRSVKFYIDGVLQALENEGVIGNWNTIASTGDWQIGGSSVKSNEFFNGAIDDFAVWNRALSTEEVLAIYNNNSELKCNEVSCVHFAEIGACDGVVSNDELLVYINRWKSGEVGISDLISAIMVWKG